MYRKVQIVVTSSPSQVAILNGFYTTAVVIFISWNKAYYIFPAQTIVNRVTYALSKDYNQTYQNNYAKYRRRGFPCQPHLILIDRSIRHVSDRFTWILAFSNNQARQPDSTDVGLEETFFSMSPKCFFTEGLVERPLSEAEWGAVIEEIMREGSLRGVLLRAIDGFIALTRFLAGCLGR